MNLKKLFDENNEFESDYYRTIWYGYFNDELDGALVNSIAAHIREDLLSPPQTKPIATHWVFYSDVLIDDALGEKVRNSLMVRELNGEFSVHYNLGDFSFLTAYDITEAFVKKLKIKLGK